MTRSIKTCRACLGSGCIHCNNRGQRVTLLWSPKDREAARLRNAIFGQPRPAAVVR